MPASVSRPSSPTGPSARNLAALVCCLGLTALSGHAMAANAVAAKAAALQACPPIEEEIVDLQLLADGLKNSSAVSVLEKLRLRAAIDDLIGLSRRREGLFAGPVAAAVRPAADAHRGAPAAQGPSPAWPAVQRLGVHLARSGG